MKHRKVRPGDDVRTVSILTFITTSRSPERLVAGLTYLFLKDYIMRKAQTAVTTPAPAPVADPVPVSYQEVQRRWLADYETLLGHYPGLSPAELLDVVRPGRSVNLRSFLREFVREEARTAEAVARRLELMALWPDQVLTTEAVEGLLRTGGDFLWGTIGGETFYRTRPAEALLRPVEGGAIDDFKLWVIETMGDAALSVAEIEALPGLPQDHYAVKHMANWLDGQSTAFYRLRSKTPTTYYVTQQGHEWARSARQRMVDATRPPLDPEGSQPLSLALEALIDHEPDICRAVFRVLSSRLNPAKIDRIAEILDGKNWLPPSSRTWTLLHDVLRKNPRLFLRKDGKKDSSWSLVNPSLRVLPPVEVRMATVMGQDVLSPEEVKMRLRQVKDTAGTFATDYIRAVLTRTTDLFEPVGSLAAEEVFFQVRQAV